MCECVVSCERVKLFTQYICEPVVPGESVFTVYEFVVAGESDAITRCRLLSWGRIYKNV